MADVFTVASRARKKEVVKTKGKLVRARGVIGEMLMRLATVASWIFSIPTLVSPFWTITGFLLRMFLSFGAVGMFYIYLNISGEYTGIQGWTSWLRYYVPWIPLIVAPETQWLVQSRLDPNVIVVVMRLATLAFGIILFLIASCQFILAKAKGVKLVKGGLYSLIRHPQYLGIIVSTAGFALYGLRPADFLAWFIVTSLYVLLALREEKKLSESFGEGYKTYRDSVPFILPKMRRLSLGGAVASTLASILLLSGLWCMLLSPTARYTETRDRFSHQIVIEPARNWTYHIDLWEGENLIVSLSRAVVRDETNKSYIEIFVYDRDDITYWAWAGIAEYKDFKIRKVDKPGPYKVEIRNPFYQQSPLECHIGFTVIREVTYRPLEPLGQWLFLVSLPIFGLGMWASGIFASIQEKSREQRS